MSGIKPLLKTSKKYVKFNFFRTLEINQRLTIIRRVFVQKNWQNLSNNRDGRHLTLLPEAPRSALGAVARRRGRSGLGTAHPRAVRVAAMGKISFFFIAE